MSMAKDEMQEAIAYHMRQIQKILYSSYDTDRKFLGTLCFTGMAKEQANYILIDGSTDEMVVAKWKK